jgi:beta-fructofuranosidase
VFFQHNPASARHEHIVWGHVSSADLLRWEDHGIALRPQEGADDSFGCWTGVGLVDDGVPTLVYSGVDGVEDAFSRVIVARLDQAGTALADPGRVVAEPPTLEGLIGVRDPFVFTHGGHRWAVQGAGVRRGDGHLPLLPLYSCDDLGHWEHVGTLLDGDDPVAAEHAPADLWECPQLVPVDGRWVLLLSLWSAGGDDDRPVNSVVHLVGDLVDGPDGAPRFVPTSGGRTDLGPDFYAPQAVLDPDGDRVLLWGWSWEGQERSQEQTDAQGWAGALTFPRVLHLEGEELRSVPAPELAALREEELPIEGGAEPVPGAAGVPAAGHEPVLELPSPARAEIRTRGPVTVEILAADGSVCEVLAADDGPATLLLDASLLEHLPDAAAPRTVRFYPGGEDRVRVRGALETAWRLAVPTARG